MLLQIIVGKGSFTSFYPVAVNPKNIVSVSFVDPSSVLNEPDHDEHISAVTFQKKILVGLNEQGEKIYLEDAFVTGHFQEISIGLKLDTDGRIADEVALKNC